MELKKRKILICGYGSIGKKHTKLVELFYPDIKVGILTAQKKINQNNQYIIFNTLASSLKWEPSYAIIASPASSHLEQAIEIAKSNIPLLIEKPIGTGLESQSKWQELETLSEKSRIQTGYVLRYDPKIKWLKDKLKDNCIGKIIEGDFYCGSWLPSWRNRDYKECVSSISNLGGGVLLELSHELDLGIFLFGDLSVNTAYCNNNSSLETNVETLLCANCINENNISISFRLNFCTQPARRSIIIRGENGELKVDFIKNYCLHCGSDDSKIEELSFNCENDSNYILQLKDFIDYQNHQNSFYCDVRHGIKVIKLISQIRQKIKYD